MILAAFYKLCLILIQCVVKTIYANAREPQRVIDNYLYRSKWHNQTILEQCKAQGKNHVFVTDESKPDEIIVSILDMMNQ